MVRLYARSRAVMGSERRSREVKLFNSSKKKVPHWQFASPMRYFLLHFNTLNYATVNLAFNTVISSPA